jgi:hypothetical protein
MSGVMLGLFIGISAKCVAAMIEYLQKKISKKTKDV